MDLDEIREKKMRQLQERVLKNQEEKEKKEQLEAQKKQLLRQILTSDARRRLSTLRMAKPEFVEKIELQLIQLAGSGRAKLPITDDQLREILRKIQGKKRSINIRRK